MAVALAIAITSYGFLMRLPRHPLKWDVSPQRT